ncbi:MAG: hypothetical protein COZ70_04925 [Deltaproteobacteria bacterium CG_4_8_14_3_um_filter_51_11]|nr:MAG: hypothetical protein COX16_14240 [Deltaproteobacteria bacterium CG23_combo_of_CG06-09_8_20_14_all_51_20]PIX20200.1 MAG: hypothetical protein COZ70_04925 [Deltaproteobacteria bacterium CG_4_8_14_3_um_filter_51_11]
MEDKLEILQKKIAFQSAICLRTCPPDSMIFDSDPEPKVKRHINTCPLCLERLESAGEAAAWKIIGSALKAPAPVSVEKVLPGEIRRVAGRMAGWGRLPAGPGRAAQAGELKYFNPPAVLVLYELDKNYFRVMQTHDDPILMGPDDVFLGDGLGFAEPWNTYPLRSDEFGDLYGTLGADLLNEAIKAEKSKFKEIDPHSVLFAFRTLELETGSFMAARSVSRLINHLETENKGVVLPFSTPKELGSFMARTRPEVVLSQQGKNVYEIIARTDFPELHMALAAESEPGWRVAIFIVSRDIGLDVIAAFYKITLMQPAPDGLLVTGRMRKADYSPNEVWGWWASKEGIYSQASQCAIDPESGIFRVVFPGIGEDIISKGKATLLFISDGRL